MPTPTHSQLTKAHQAAILAVRSRLELFARYAWVGLGSYREKDIDRLAEMIVPKVLAGQQQVAGLTDAYIGALAGSSSVGVDPKLVTGGNVRMGTKPDDVYRRPGVTVYTELSKGKAVDAAIAAGGKRLLSLVTTDLQLGMRAQERISFSGKGFKFYRRELTGRENCALCAIASTQRYRVGTLKPIHPGCDCTVASYDAGEDPGQVIDPDMLEQIHTRVGEHMGGGTDRGARDLGLGKVDAKGNQLSDYTDLIITREHSEYGPTLSWRKDKFTTAKDIAS